MFPLRPDQLKVMREQAMASDGAVERGRAEGGDDAAADEDGEVEAVLRVPFWRCRDNTRLVQFSSEKKS